VSRPPYRLLSLLLLYPDEELLAARPAIGEAIAALPGGPEKRTLERFWADFGEAPAAALQARYVETFDLQKRASLYLTYFTEGDTRQRGQALLRLKRLYRAAGLDLAEGELPDFLPVLLEFCDLVPDGAPRLLAEHRRGVELLRLHLLDSHSPYAHLLEAVAAGLPKLGVADLEAVRRLLEEGPPAEQVGLEPFAPPEVMPLSAGAPR
jgi:nitrate reductase molybdenum cofactor assembly chaperone NarJ/NarW